MMNFLILVTPWLIPVIAATYFLASFFFVWREAVRNLADRPLSPGFSVDSFRWIRQSLCFAFIMLDVCADRVGYDRASVLSSLLLASVLIGQATRWLARRWAGKLRSERRQSVYWFIVYNLVVYMIYGLLFDDASRYYYEYQATNRLAGPWNNPNVFGLIMACGLVLVTGWLIQCLLWRSQSIEMAISRWRLTRLPLFDFENDAF